MLVYVAENENDLETGLMGINSLPRDQGMLFILESEDYPQFWMKNTFIPLDIIFVSKNLTIVDIISAPPCTADPCPTYTPKEKASYVVEVNQGFASEKGVTVGQKIKIE